MRKISGLRPGLASTEDRAQKKFPEGWIILPGTLSKAAAAYSPTWWGSTIGASGLDFSVRYG